MKADDNRVKIIWNYLGTGLTISTNFILLPFLMIYLNPSMLGMWQIFLSAGAIATLLDFGLSPALARSTAYAWSGASTLKKEGFSNSAVGEPNYLMIKKIHATVKKIYLLISTVGLILLLSVGTLYIYKIGDIKGFNWVIISWIIYCLGIFSNIFFGYYTVMLRGIGKITELNKAVVIGRVMQITITISILLIKGDIIAPTIGFVLYGFVFRYLSRRSFFSKELNKEFSKLSNEKDLEIKGVFKSIWHNAWKDGLIALSKYLSGQFLVIIASFYTSLEQVGIYSIMTQIVMAIISIASVLYSTYQPKMQTSVFSGDSEQAKKMFGLSMVGYYIVAILGAVGFLLVGIPLLNMVKPGIQFNKMMFLVVFVVEFLRNRYMLYASFLSNYNEVPYLKAFLISSVVSLAAILFVVMMYSNIYMMILIPLLVDLIYNFWKWPYDVNHRLSTTTIDLYVIGIKELKKLVKTGNK